MAPLMVLERAGFTLPMDSPLIFRNNQYGKHGSNKDNDSGVDEKTKEITVPCRGGKAVVTHHLGEE